MESLWKALEESLDKSVLEFLKFLEESEDGSLKKLIEESRKGP